MKHSNSLNKIVGLFALVFSALTLSACGGKNWFSYTGWETKPENRYVLKQGGPHGVVWTSADLEVHYRYVLKDNRLDMEGYVVRQNRIKHFDQLRAWVSIHMLDENGVILDTHRLWSTNGSHVYVGFRSDFRKSWELPADNKAVGFSFTGVAGGGEDGSWDFWQTP